MSELEVKVNMMAQARNAQWNPTTFLGPGWVKALAPAKVNLFLGVGEPNAQAGFHNVTTCMHSLALHDTLWANATPHAAEMPADLPEWQAIGGPDGNLLIKIDITDKVAAFGEEEFTIPAAQNIVFTAIDTLAKKLGRTAPEEIGVHIEKQIPHQAGLGGGSADAAAALVALAKLWGVDAGHPAILETAQEIGSDVAFFLFGGCACLTGRGEALHHTLAPAKTPVVIVKPQASVSTAQAYATFDQNPAAIPQDLLTAVYASNEATAVPLFNNMQAAAQEIAPELAEVAQWLTAQEGTCATLLCGSGAATFSTCATFAQASAIAAAASRQGWWARPTTLSSLRAAVVPTK
jgi:4-diphosphocytidyl-2-C-methyl-D-erythritol kinase